MSFETGKQTLWRDLPGFWLGFLRCPKSWREENRDLFLVPSLVKSRRCIVRPEVNSGVSVILERQWDLSDWEVSSCLLLLSLCSPSSVDVSDGFLLFLLIGEWRREEAPRQVGGSWVTY